MGKEKAPSLIKIIVSLIILTSHQHNAQLGANTLGCIMLDLTFKVRLYKGT